MYLKRVAWQPGSQGYVETPGCNVHDIKTDVNFLTARPEPAVFPLEFDPFVLFYWAIGA